MLDALLGLVLGHPQRAMAAAHALWQKTDNEADLADWEEARVTLMDDVDDELRTLWTGADFSEREVLVFVAAGLSPYSRAEGRARGGNTVRAVKALAARGVIAKGGDGAQYVVDPLFAEWIRGQRGRPDG